MLPQCCLYETIIKFFMSIMSHFTVSATRKFALIISVYTHTVHAENYMSSLKPSSNSNENPEEKRPNTINFIVEF